MTTKSKFQQSPILAARVRLHDGRTCTLFADFRNGTYDTCFGVIRLSDIAEVGDDVKFRSRKFCAQHNLKFVAMSSLSKK